MNILNSKLFLLIDSFSDHDIKEFKKLITSNFFSNGRNYKGLLNLILKIKKKKLKEYTSDQFYSDLFPDKKFSVQTLDNRMSELFKLAEEYLIIKTLRENKAERNKILLLAFYNQKSSRFFEKQYSRTKKLITSEPESDNKYFSLSFIDRLNISYSNEKVISENTYTNYYEHSQYITALFLKNLFDFGFEFIQQEQTNRTFDFNIVNEFLKSIEISPSIINKLQSSDRSIFKIVIMEFYFYKMFKTPEEIDNYFEGRKLFVELSDSLDENYKISLYKKLTNYCILRQNQGIKKFQKELFDLYNEQLKLGHFPENKKAFPSTTFRNYVLIGIIVKRIKWTEDFIKKYSEYLPEDNRDDEIKLSYSKLFFSSKHYKKSLECLTSFKGQNYMHYCDASILKLCTYYETEKFEEAFSEMDKLKHYLRNHSEVPEIHREYFLNFLKIYLLLIKIKTGVNNKDLTELENQINKKKLRSREHWLREKISELKNSE